MPLKIQMQHVPGPVEVRQQKLAQNNNLRSRVKKFRMANLEKVKALTDQAAQSFREKGIAVQMAADGPEALQIAESTVKSSPVTVAPSRCLREIGLEEALSAKGLEVVQTGLTDFPPGSRPEEMEFREKVRRALSCAECGITGASAIIAEHGSIAIMENEGNARAVSNLATHHLAVAGIDQIVTDTAEAVALCRAASIFGPGPDIPRYLSFITGPSSTADVEGFLVKGMHGPPQVTVILLDNGRTWAIKRGFSEILLCVDCGACLEVCPAFRQKGSCYGDLYPGGRGLVFAAVQGKNEALEKMADCRQCGSCRQVCPMEIDTPGYIRLLKESTPCQRRKSNGAAKL